MSGFSTLKLYFPTLPNLYSWKEVTLWSPHLVKGVILPSCLVKYLHKFGILLSGRFVFSPPLINLFNHLFLSVWIQGYLFHTLVYNPVLLHLFFVPALAIGSSFSWLLCTCNTSPSIKKFFKALPYFLRPQDGPGST